MAQEHATSGLQSAEKYHFLLWRLHSLSGLIPLGVFVFVHLLSNAMILAGPDEFQTQVERIHALGPLLIPVEIVGIFIPLLFHTILGIWIIFTGQHNVAVYGGREFSANVRYTLQRVSAWIVLVFIGYHVYQMHWIGAIFPGGGAFKVHDGELAVASATTAAVFDRGWWVAPLYAVGVIATAFHVANGVWTAMITWGITIRARSQQVSGYICAAFGIVLGLLGLGSLAGFKNFDADAAFTTQATAEHAETTGTSLTALNKESPE